MLRKFFYGIVLTMLILGTLYVAIETRQVSSWSNGGFSSDPSHPVYGTHDWIAQHALDWLPSSEKHDIVDNLAAYLYGTELPDNSAAPDGIGDTTLHHFYYWSNESIQDDAAAVRAQDEYDQAVSFARHGNVTMAVKTLGIVSHYIVDLCAFGHVMASETDWGAEVHHSDYESYVNDRTDNFTDEFNSYLTFDGSLDLVSANDAAQTLAYDTTFDVDGDHTCVWMDQNYDWNNSTFKDRVGESLNLAVNYLADVLHTFALDVSGTLMIDVAGTTYIVTVDTDYIVSNHSFNPTMGRLEFQIEGSTAGPCNVTIPKRLLSGAFTVYSHGQSTLSVTEWNATHYFIHFVSPQSSDEIRITGEYAVPIPGDLNHDGIVDIYDALILSNHFNEHFP